MKHLFSLICLALVLSSCGTFHKVTNKGKTENSSDLQTEFKVDSETSKSADAMGNIHTLITEKVDTHITVPSTSVVVARPLTELIENKTIIAQDGKASIQVTYDPLTGTIRAVGKSDSYDLPVQSSKVTQVKEDYKSSETVEQDIESSGDTSLETDSHVEAENIVTDNKTSSGFGWGSLTGILFLLGACAVAFYLDRRR